MKMMADKTVCKLTRKNTLTELERVRLMRALNSRIMLVSAIASALADDCDRIVEEFQRADRTLTGVEERRISRLEVASERLNAFNDYLNDAPLPFAPDVR